MRTKRRRASFVLGLLAVAALATAATAASGDTYHDTSKQSPTSYVSTVR